MKVMISKDKETRYEIKRHIIDSRWMEYYVIEDDGDWMLCYILGICPALEWVHKSSLKILSVSHDLKGVKPAIGFIWERRKMSDAQKAVNRVMKELKIKV